MQAVEANVNIFDQMTSIENCNRRSHRLRSELPSGGLYIRRDAEALPPRTASQKLARVSLGDAPVAAGPYRSV
jgi:hypothetical protein